MTPGKWSSEPRASATGWRYPSLTLRALILLVLAPSLPAAGYEQRQGPAVAILEGGRVEAGRVTARLADEILLTVTVEGDFPLHFKPSDAAVEQEQIKSLQAAGVWLGCAVRTERSRPADGRERWRQTIRLDPLKAAEVKLQLAPLTFTEGPLKKPHQVDWEPIPVVITTEVVEPDLKEMRDGVGPEELPPVRSWWLPWLIGLGLALLAAGLVVAGWGLKRRLARPGPPLTPHEWALAELGRVEALGLPAAGQAERYHTLLSGVLRRYFELRFDLPASQQTTAEFLAAVRARPELAAPQQDQLREFLERCDLAKFAPVIPSAEESRATAALARALMEQTAVAAGQGS